MSNEEIKLIIKQLFTQSEYVRFSECINNFIDAEEIILNKLSMLKHLIEDLKLNIEIEKVWLTNESQMAEMQHERQSLIDKHEILLKFVKQYRLCSSEKIQTLLIDN